MDPNDADMCDDCCQDLATSYGSTTFTTDDEWTSAREGNIFLKRDFNLIDFGYSHGIGARSTT